MDGKFEAMHGDLADLEIALNKTARDEHVSDIKRFIHMLKERMQAIYNSPLFTNMPPQILIEMANHTVYWLNAFPHQERNPSQEVTHFCKCNAHISCDMFLFLQVTFRFFCVFLQKKPYFHLCTYFLFTLLCMLLLPVISVTGPSFISQIQ
jgi:hypothetical protein